MFRFDSAEVKHFWHKYLVGDTVLHLFNLLFYLFCFSVFNSTHQSPVLGLDSCSIGGSAVLVLLLRNF